MRFGKLLQLGLIAALGQVACNWTDFNSVLDKAPVVSFDNGASNTGSVVALPLPPPPPGGKVSARMLVARPDIVYLALAEFDKDGKVTVREVGDSNLANLGSIPVSSMAALDPSKVDSPIILGTPRFDQIGDQPARGRVSLLSMTTLADGTASFSVQPGLQLADHFGIAVASGRVRDLSGPPEFVAVSDFVVQLLAPDASTSIAATDCQSVSLYDPSSGLLAKRSIAVADLLPGGGEEIVLGGLGRVIFVQYDPVSQKLVCSPLVLTQTGSSHFGESLAVADFDGDGQMDLAVGASPNRVYVYFGPFVGTDASAIATMTIASTGGSAFGKRIATYTVPGQQTSQLLVADPMTTGGSRARAGKVVLLKMPPRTSQPLEAASLTITTIFDSNEDDPTDAFGDSLGSLWFDTRTCNAAGSIALPLWASCGTKVLTFFNYPTNATVPPPAPVADPRCFVK